jgi:hypothetical protein
MRTAAFRDTLKETSDGGGVIAWQTRLMSAVSRRQTSLFVRGKSFATIDLEMT